LTWRLARAGLRQAAILPGSRSAGRVGSFVLPRRPPRYRAKTGMPFRSSVAVAAATQSRSPGVSSVAFRARVAGSTLRVLDGYGLRGKWPARPTLAPCTRFLSIDPHVCFTLPSDLASRRQAVGDADYAAAIISRIISQIQVTLRREPGPCEQIMIGPSSVIPDPAPLHLGRSEKSSNSLPRNDFQLCNGSPLPAFCQKSPCKIFPGAVI
jgi:hypothetical protein